MTRINHLQERAVSLQNVSEIPVNMLHRVKKKSAVLMMISWQTSGAPNSVGFAGCDQYIQGNTTQLRTSIPYVGLAGIGVPVYAGPAGNTIGMAAVAIKGSDISGAQGSYFPHNVIVKLTGNVGRVTVYAIELSNYPVFKFRDIVVTNFNNLSAGSLAFNSSTRPSSLDFVGVSFATPSAQTVNNDWGGGDKRYYGPSDYIESYSRNSPYSMKQAAEMMGMMGGINSGNLGDSWFVNRVFDNFTAPFRSGPNSMSLPRLVDAEGNAFAPESAEYANAWAQWLDGRLLRGLQEGQEVGFDYGVWQGATGTGSAGWFFRFGRSYVDNPDLLKNYDGTGPDVIEMVGGASLQADDVLVGWGMNGGGFISARTYALNPNLGILDEVSIRDIMGGSETGGSGFVNELIEGLYNILQARATQIRSKIDSGDFEAIPPG